MKKILFSLFVGAAVMASAQTQFQQEAVGYMAFTNHRIVQLAKAMPDDNFDWSPESGVRSFSGILGHVVSGNYFLASKIGGVIPEGVNPMTIEKEITSRADLLKALDESNQFAIAAINALKEEEMGDKVEMPFPGDFTKMGVVNIIMNHGSEHMGQLIAYCRSNGVTPPWSVAPGE